DPSYEGKKLKGRERSIDGWHMVMAERTFRYLEAYRDRCCSHKPKVRWDDIKGAIKLLFLAGQRDFKDLLKRNLGLFNPDWDDIMEIRIKRWKKFLYNKYGAVDFEYTSNEKDRYWDVFFRRAALDVTEAGTMRCD